MLVHLPDAPQSLEQRFRNAKYYGSPLAIDEAWFLAVVSELWLESVLNYSMLLACGTPAESVAENTKLEFQSLSILEDYKGFKDTIDHMSEFLPEFLDFWAHESLDYDDTEMCNLIKASVVTIFCFPVCDVPITHKVVDGYSTLFKEYIDIILNVAETFLEEFPLDAPDHFIREWLNFFYYKSITSAYLGIGKPYNNVYVFEHMPELTDSVLRRCFRRADPMTRQIHIRSEYILAQLLPQVAAMFIPHHLDRTMVCPPSTAVKYVFSTDDLDDPDEHWCPAANRSYHEFMPLGDRDVCIACGYTEGFL